MNNQFSKIKNFFKGWHEKKITLLLITGGVGVLSTGFAQDWWKSVLISFANEVFHTHIQYTEEPTNYVYLTIATLVGAGLIGLGLWFYFKTKEKAKKQTMLQIRHSSIESVDYSKVDVDLSDYNIEPYPILQSEELKVLKEPNLHHALREQEKTVTKILQRIDGNADIELSYWGLAHIPLLFLLGYQLADKSNSSFFEWNQNKLRWEKVKEKHVVYPPLKIEKTDSKQSVEETKEVVVKIGVTYPVNDTDLSGLHLDSLNSFYLHLEPPHRNAIVCKEQLNEYQKRFRQLLDEINQTFPQLERIHLFYSGQPSLAYRLGSSISPRMDKEIWVYNYVGLSQPKYNWAINLKKIGNQIDIKLPGGELL
ncbi:SAVED domain-containing protein [Fredinandcohnia quinoae]|uniref:SAVED domain-containing protein n=1 Tax=Fredinandcohnia quinoae TaxID=2918902 RepID=A0AAW5E4E8_9BACI|nr:SAVED domain-containing protein [Fredinandcohnia sp. SECRCQ15]MCH1626120.1 SAVED domain-containing protein [Fredinandcohnia sp. SECRCQ15]